VDDEMTVTFTASTGVKIIVWREQDMFAASRADAPEEAQICMGVDLFEVIAELAGLDLDEQRDAQEATRRAAEARQRLSSLPAQRRPY
jgi:hypothetical protein